MSMGLSDDVYMMCHRLTISEPKIYIHLPVGVLVQDIAIGAGGREFDSGPVKPDAISPTARRDCDVSSELLPKR